MKIKNIFLIFALFFTTYGCGPSEKGSEGGMMWERDWCGWVVVNKESYGLITIENAELKKRATMFTTDVTFNKYNLLDTICKPSHS